MLAKLNQYRQSWTQPFTSRFKAFQPQFSFEWVQNLKELQQVQRFRAEQFSDQFGIQFQDQLDQDIYDFNCEHAVVREKWSGEIVAYTRVRALKGHELDKSYSEQEFHIAQDLSHLGQLVEIGRTCVHPEFRSGRALSMLWLHLAPKLLWEMRAKHLIGCVSIRLGNNQARAYHTHQYLQNLDDSRIIDIKSKQAYHPRMPEVSWPQDQRIPKLFDAYLNMQAKLSREAYYDEEFNCLDYFVCLEVNQIAQNFVFNKLIKSR